MLYFIKDSSKFYLNFFCLLAVSSISKTSYSFTENELKTPEGYWLTIDDATKKERGIIELFIDKKDGKEELKGRIVTTLYIPGESWSQACIDCMKPFTDQPIEGLECMWQFHKNGDTWNSQWIEGKIFDASQKNKTYDAKLWLADDGKKLMVRGYLWLFYRTQEWIRIDSNTLNNYQKLAAEQLQKYPKSP